MPSWPSKEEREKRELSWFLCDYQKLEWGRELTVVRKRERPDYELSDPEGRDLIGVELTSVYLDDRSVPDLHMLPPEKFRVPARASAHIELYRKRLVAAVRDKVSRARAGYEIYPSMVLAVFVAEYIAHYLRSRRDWEKLFEENQSELEEIGPFTELIFFGLANGGVFGVRP